MLATSRPLLCWEDRTYATVDWERSWDNKHWTPNLTYYPSTCRLQTGDIVLYQPLNPSFTQRAIQMYEGGRFTHAAIYLQSDQSICEASAVKKKVVTASLEDTLEGNCVLFRRVKNLSDQGRERIALAAMDMHRQPYDFAQLFKNVLARASGLDSLLEPTKTGMLDSPLICSTLCEHAILAALANGQSLTKRRGDLVMPEDLAATDLLEDVDMCWCLVNWLLSCELSTSSAAQESARQSS